MLTGSSGGLVSFTELQEAVVGRQHFQVPQPSMSISVEATRFDVTNKKATNCKVPSYCVACSLIGADLPDAYKPCFESRTAFVLPSSLTEGEALKSPLPKGNTGETILYWRIPLYRGNGVLLP